MQRTRLGKIVGSIKNDPDGFTFWAENNWTTGEPGYIVVAPSGARMTWYPTKTQAQDDVRERNAGWFS